MRAGGPFSVSATEVGVDIVGQLGQFQTKFTVAYSPDGMFFVIETSSAAAQLQVLGCRSLEGENFVLDLALWCLDYETCDLPWIVVPDTEGEMAGPARRCHYSFLQLVSFSMLNTVV